MRRRPVFADPKTDFVFQRIFGSEEHKKALLGLINDLLDLDEAHRVKEVMFLPPELRPKVSELKYSIVDVRCTDVRGIQYVVEMQVLNVEAFEKRVVYNVAKTYTNQLGGGEDYPSLNDVIGISICDFELFPRKEGSKVPMRSRFRMQEQQSGELGLSSLQFVFLELPKYEKKGRPQTRVEKWAYFFREADNLDVIPDELTEESFKEALEAARTAKFSAAEWDAYIAAGMAIQNERGALSLAHKQGKAEGRAEGKAEGLQEGLRQAIRDLCDVLSIEVNDDREQKLLQMNSEELMALRDGLKREKTWP